MNIIKTKSDMVKIDYILYFYRGNFCKLIVTMISLIHCRKMRHAGPSVNPMSIATGFPFILLER